MAAAGDIVFAAGGTKPRRGAEFMRPLWLNARVSPMSGGPWKISASFKLPMDYFFGCADGGSNPFNRRYIERDA